MAGIGRLRAEPSETDGSNSSRSAAQSRLSGFAARIGYQPTGVEPDSYGVVFPEDRAEITRRDGTITTTLEIAASPEVDAEVCRLSISNLGKPTDRQRTAVTKRGLVRHAAVG